MNRRGFLEGILAAGAAFAILPAATLYTRQWKPVVKEFAFDPRLYHGDWDFVNAEFAMELLLQEQKWPRWWDKDAFPNGVGYVQERAKDLWVPSKL